MPTSRWIDHDAGLPRLGLPTWIGLLLVALLSCKGNLAWAYKVEKICSETPASAAEPAKKSCKIVRVDPSKAPAPKEEKKDEKKKSGH